MIAMIHDVDITAIEENISDQAKEMFGLNESDFENDYIKTHHWRIVDFVTEQLDNLSTSEFNDVVEVSAATDGGRWEQEVVVSQTFIDKCLMEM